MTSVIDRPNIGYDDDAHAYTIDDVPVPGVSSISKYAEEGGFERGAWWGWGMVCETVPEMNGVELMDTDQLRGALRHRGCDPIKRRDAGGTRGTAVHDALEALALKGTIPDPSDYPAEQRGHIRSLVRWFLEYRPEFEAVEVMVGSRRHMYAGRYDIRATIPGIGLVLIDLKTSKGVYPKHLVQLEGYELASVEMGFPATAGRWVLRTSEDGSFVPHYERPPHKWDETNFVESWATPEQFLACLTLYKQMQALEADDPAQEWRLAVEAYLLDYLAESGPALSRVVAATDEGGRLHLTGRDAGRAFGRLRKQGLVTQASNKQWALS